MVFMTGRFVIDRVTITDDAATCIGTVPAASPTGVGTGRASILLTLRSLPAVTSAGSGSPPPGVPCKAFKVGTASLHVVAEGAPSGGTSSTP